MSNDTMQINFAAFDGPVYSGRSRGEQVRIKLNLDSVDKNDDLHVQVTIPDDTYSVTSSFFLGVFGPSIVRAGSAARFFDKFHITAKQAISERIHSFVERALQQKSLFG